jgi:hypothetical protein
MSPDMVTDIMGDPTKTQSLNSAGLRIQYWYYPHGDNMLQIAFENGYVTAINSL